MIKRVPYLFSPVDEHSSGSRGASEVEAIRNWLVSQVAKLANIPEEDVDIQKEFDYYGLSSAESVGLIGDLEEWLDRPLDASIMWDYPTIASLSRYLAEKK